MLPELFVYLGVTISSVSYFVYLFDTLKGTVTPNRVTFSLWAAAPLLAFSAQMSQEVGIHALLAFSASLGPLMILGASFFHKNKAWELTSFDYICGSVSICGLIIWQVTQIGNIAILFSIISDIFAAIPTIIKSYKAPQTESARSYLLAVIGGFITVSTIQTWNFATYGFPLYLVFINLVIFAVLLRGGKFTKQKRTSL